MIRKLILRSAVTALVALLILPAGSLAQSTAAPDTVPVDSSAVSPTRSLLFLPDRFYQTGTTLTFSMKPQSDHLRLFGYRKYEATRLECAYQGAARGVTLGMAAGAFGMMVGAWDEEETWYIAGAMAALGALYGGFIKDDAPSWKLRIRYDPDR